MDLNVSNLRNDAFQAPSAVMRTAVTTVGVSNSLDINTAPSSTAIEMYVFLHFAELRELSTNETTEMDIYLNGNMWHQGFSPQYRISECLSTPVPLHFESYNYSIRASNRSTLPPILNAMEVYALNWLAVPPTDSGDVNAILEIKDYYQIKRNWWGDPCAPQKFLWEGLNCTYDASPRITTLNLNSSGLTGEIHASIANLTNLRSLDLSQNNLTGVVPDFLVELRSLQILNLANNKLTGVVPRLLYEKSRNGLLLVSIYGNPDLCYNKETCQKKNKKKTFIPIIIATLITLMVLIAILLWAFKRRRNSRNKSNILVMPFKKDGSSHLLKCKDPESQQFTYFEIANITNNFVKEIGKGGFGAVFFGILKDGTQVAVKLLSKLSSQGEKEFKAEALTLMRVHHRNLVSMLGYCDEKDNLALVYEYMAQGCLVDHLRGETSNRQNLSWRVRMRIALEAAQGIIIPSS